jgi:hypothetical protein
MRQKYQALFFTESIKATSAGKQRKILRLPAAIYNFEAINFAYFFGPGDMKKSIQPSRTSSSSILTPLRVQKDIAARISFNSNLHVLGILILELLGILPILQLQKVALRIAEGISKPKKEAAPRSPSSSASFRIDTNRFIARTGHSTIGPSPLPSVGKLILIISPARLPSLILIISSTCLSSIAFTRTAKGGNGLSDKKKLVVPS